MLGRLWATVLAVLLVVLCVEVEGYARFGPARSATPRPEKSINQQILEGSGQRFHGRFRSGTDDNLYRYLNNL
ncbi:unnamed protein product, partial [Mesorhabditis spiculigera]